MRIHRLVYQNKRLGWSLDPIDFSNLTLLVGVSGVGKTRILRSISALKRISEGASLSGVAWELEFTASNGVRYRWKGEFEVLGDASSMQVFEDDDDPFSEDAEERRAKPRIIREELHANESPIVMRDAGEIFLNGSKTPRLASHQSVLKTLSEEESISSASSSFGRIVYSDQTSSAHAASSFHYFEFAKLSKKHTTLESIRESTVPTLVKLALCSVHAPNTFKEIGARFVDIFPYVESIRMEPQKGDAVPRFMQDIPLLSIKEKAVDQWISQQNISSGMFRTMLHISELFLSPDGTVILIDEFENSLGVNCIDVVTEDLLNQSRRLQFIVTSHHPYVISNVGVEHWKLVSRRGSVVTTRDAASFKLGTSSHDAFMQLINLDEYKEGIALE